MHVVFWWAPLHSLVLNTKQLKRVKKKLTDITQIATADLDQAFEACTSEEFVAALNQSVREYLDLVGTPEDKTFISVHKGRRFRTKARRSWTLSWLSIPLSVIRQALVIFINNVRAHLGSLWLLMRGLPIGAIPSAACVDLVLGKYESN